MVEWENGDISEEPLNWMIKENPIPVAQYAIESDMLDTPGGKQLKRLAKREKLLTRLIKQAKLRSFQKRPDTTAIVYSL